MEKLSCRIVFVYHKNIQSVDDVTFKASSKIVNIHIGGLAKLFGLEIPKTNPSVYLSEKEDQTHPVLIEVFWFEKKDLTNYEKNHLESILKNTAQYLDVTFFGLHECFFHKPPYKMNLQGF